MTKTNNYFNLNEFKAGKTCTTKLGNPVKFITMCGDGKMLVQITPRYRIIDGPTKYAVGGCAPYNDRYYVNGKKYNGTDTEFDLVMEAPKVLRDEKGRFVKRG